MQPRFLPFLPAALGLMVIGWGGMLLLVLLLPPTVWARWAFYACVVLAVSGTALPAVYFLHRRFPGDLPTPPAVIVRQSNWIGLYAATLLWLSAGRLLTYSSALLLAVALILLEWLLRQIEHSQRPAGRVPPPGLESTPPEPPDVPPA